MERTDPRVQSLNTFSLPMVVYNGENNTARPKQTEPHQGEKELDLPNAAKVNDMWAIIQGSPEFRELIARAHRVTLRVEQLESAQKASFVKIESLEDKVQRLESENNSLKERNLTLQHNESEKDKIIQGLFEKLEKLAITNQSHKGIIEDLQANTNKLSENNLALTHSIHQISEENKRVRESHSKLSSAYEMVKGQLDLAVEQMKRSILACDESKRRLIDEQFRAGIETHLKEWAAQKDFNEKFYKTMNRVGGYGLGFFTFGIGTVAVEGWQSVCEKVDATEWKELIDLTHKAYLEFMNSEPSVRDEEWKKMLATEAYHHWLHHGYPNCEKYKEWQDWSNSDPWYKDYSACREKYENDFIAKSKLKYPPYQKEVIIEDVWRHLEFKFKHEIFPEWEKRERAEGYSGLWKKITS